MCIDEQWKEENMFFILCIYADDAGQVRFMPGPLAIHWKPSSGTYESEERVWMHHDSLDLTPENLGICWDNVNICLLGLSVSTCFNRFAHMRESRRHLLYLTRTPIQRMMVPLFQLSESIVFNWRVWNTAVTIATFQPYLSLFIHSYHLPNGNRMILEHVDSIFWEDASR